MQQPDDQMQQQQQQQPDQQQQIVLPPGFIENPSGYLANVASRAPSPDGLEKLAGPVAKWFVSAAGNNATAAGGGNNTAGDFHAAVQVAPLYLQAASVQLKGYDGGGGGGGRAAASSSASSAANNRQQSQSSIQLEMIQT
eukprot:CAMPEP_0113476024 /NCGR_PEP_ID=MMETSP0014_2-20120614/19437_1 /TAXON_ID=2857 /ORGANISM="Nitzschia sp." /LENGTH=139 /DNA_ID=CAMNT_0000368991 /DNA_START=140 /DNA_END=555 /DNA_ORIENTATION=+ /assembly_acc=CAM_ASM_000159